MLGQLERILEISDSVAGLKSKTLALSATIRLFIDARFGLGEGRVKNDGPPTRIVWAHIPFVSFAM